MTINYTNLLGLAKPVTGTETGQWGDVVNDQITELVEDAVANASSISVTSGDVTLTTTTGSANQARMSTLIITGSPGVTRNVIAPSQAKTYVVINQSNASVVIKGAATTGVTLLASEKASVAWNGSDFVKIATQSGNGDFVTVDTTNLEVTNIKAKDGTAAASIADSTGVISITSNPILSGGTANGVAYLNGSKVLTTGSALTFDGTNIDLATVGAKVNFATTSSATRNYVGGAADGFSLEMVTQRGASQPLSYKQDYAVGHAWSIAGSGAMTLTSTGLGIGTSSPSNKLTVAGNINTTGAGYIRSVGTGSGSAGVGPNIGVTDNGYYWIQQLNASSGYDTWFYNGSWNLRTTLDSSGNLGLGVTPSAWALSGAQAVQVKNASIAGYLNNAYLSANVYFDSAGASRYIASAAATQYAQFSGAHYWYVGASGTAGNAISFTQAMTLDANGKLVLYTTTSGDNLTLNTASGQNFTTLNFQNAGSTKSQIYFDNSATSLIFANNGSERARITSGGNFCIGTTTVGLASNSSTALTVANGTNTVYSSLKGSTVEMYSAVNTTEGALITYTNHPLVFGTNNTERARITSGGDFLVGKTATAATVVGIQLLPSGAAAFTRSGSTNATSTLDVYSTGASAYRFYVDMAGTIFATSTTISAISDRRLKENIRDLDVGLNAVMALKPRKFDWKAGKGKDKKDDRGFIAQEFEQVFPDLIDTWKDPAPEGEEPYKAVRADLIPVLVKAIQEQQALITALTARVAALESKGV